MVMISNIFSTLYLISPMIYIFFCSFQLIDNIGDPIELLSYLGPPDNTSADSPGQGQGTPNNNNNSSSGSNQNGTNPSSNNDDLLALFE